MKLYYIANIRMPTEKAHGIQIMEMCQAFSYHGVDVELIVPRRLNPLKDDPFAYHDVKKVFSIKYLPCLDLVRFGRVGFWIELLTFSLSVLVFSLFKKGTFFTRDEPIAVLLEVVGKRVGWEAHMGHKNLFTSALIRTNAPIIVISKGLEDLYTAMGAKRVLVAEDGADIDRFNIDLPQADARKKIGLPLDKKIILHKGHLYDYVGAPDLARAMGYVKSDAIGVFIGGTEEDVAAFKAEFGDKGNVLILGNRPRPETPIYQKAADILVIANSAKFERTKSFASPLKLFGYLASGVPIIATDLPAMRNILDESIVTFAEPDNPESLAKAIDAVLESYPEAKQKTGKALALAERYTWKNRASSILDFLS